MPRRAGQRDKRPLRRLCDEQLGKNERRAPSVAEWLGVTEALYSLRGLLCEGVEALKCSQRLDRALAERPL